MLGVIRHQDRDLLEGHSSYKRVRGQDLRALAGERVAQSTGLSSDGASSFAMARTRRRAINTALASDHRSRHDNA